MIKVTTFEIKIDEVNPFIKGTYLVTKSKTSPEVVVLCTETSGFNMVEFKGVVFISHSSDLEAGTPGTFRKDDFSPFKGKIAFEIQ